MKIHHALEPRGDRPPIALAIGFFDGLHRGHRALFAALEPYVAAGARPAALSFRRHPAHLLRPEAVPKLLVTLEERVNLLARAGIEELYLLPFDETIAGLSPEAFMEGRVAEMLRPRAVAVGTSFRFGAGRAGDAAGAAALLARRGIPLHAVPHVTDGAERISSTRIRELVAAGDLAAADALLGAPYALIGEVALGLGRGHDLGFPTANVAVAAELQLPPDGVYTARVAYEGASYRGLVSIGTNPTFDGVARTIEAWIDGFAETIYGRQIRLDRLRLVRGQRRFASVEDLRRRMLEDVEALHERMPLASDRDGGAASSNRPNTP